MTSLTYSICFLFFTFAASSVFAQSTATSSKEKGVYQESLTPDIYFSALTAVRNQEKKLPALSYWGVGKAVWGEDRAAVLRVSPDLKSDATSSGSCDIAGYSCAKSAHFDATKTLGSIRYELADAVEDRSKRLKIYNAILDRFTREYSAPSEQILPAEKVRGVDAFVQGLDDRYEVRWVGSQTDVSLVLTPKELFVEFRKAARGTPQKNEASFQAFEKLRSKAPKDHSIHKIGRKN